MYKFSLAKTKYIYHQAAQGMQQLNRYQPAAEVLERHFFNRLSIINCILRMRRGFRGRSPRGRGPFRGSSSGRGRGERKRPAPHQEHPQGPPVSEDI